MSKKGEVDKRGAQKECEIAAVIARMEPKSRQTCNLQLIGSPREPLKTVSQQHDLPSRTNCSCCTKVLPDLPGALSNSSRGDQECSRAPGKSLTLGGEILDKRLTPEQGSGNKEDSLSRQQAIRRPAVLEDSIREARNKR